MFPALGSPKPSILRHMTPFRAAYTEGQRLLAPLIPQQLVDNMRQQMNPYQGQHTLMNSLPVPPPLRQAYSRFGSHQMKRHSPMDNHWRAKMASEYSASKLDAQHMEPLEIVENDNLIDENFDHNNFEEIKFIPLDSSHEPTIEEEDLSLVQRPTKLEKKSRPSRQNQSFRQQRDQQLIWEKSNPESKLDSTQIELKPCVQTTSKPHTQTTSTTTSTLEPKELVSSSTVRQINETTTPAALIKTRRTGYQLSKRNY